MKVLPVSVFLDVLNAQMRELWSSGEEVAVEGEVSGFRVSQGQWITFDLKDDKALVNVFLPVWNLRVPVEDGLKVRVFGVPRVYPKYGKFSFSADRVEIAGEGALRKALAMLRARLDAEGLFDPTRKRALPRFPRRVALITSREAAAYGDFVRVLGERWRGLEIDLFHVLVQGARAPESICAALRVAQSDVYDAIVLTRGGGSLEELMAFNDERVVRAVHASRIPTLVGVGHERDVTLAEEAADVRASTPTDCARRLVPDRRDVLYELAAVTESCERSLLDRIARIRVAAVRAVRAPEAWVARRRDRAKTLAARVVETGGRWHRRLGERLETLSRVIGQADPQLVLSRGYAIVCDPDRRAITRSSQLRPGASISLRFADGEADAVAGAVRASGAEEHPRPSSAERREPPPASPFRPRAPRRASPDDAQASLW